jgi:hypothetical protein
MDRECVIKIVPDKSFVDESVNITISGLQKRQKVTLRAVSQDYYCMNAGMSEQGQNSVWESYGIFTSDDNGMISLGDTIPMEGTYQTNDAMGLFYSMRIKKLIQAQPRKKLSEVNENRRYHMHFTVEVDGKVLASEIHIRQFCDETIKSETLMKDNLIARYFTSSFVQKRATIIVVSGSEGRIEKAQAIAQVLAYHGYSSLAVCYFGLEGAAPSLNMIPLDIIKEAIQWLKRQDTVDDQRIGIYGRSKGGEFALTAASFFHDLTCVIANTPSCYVYEGLKNGMPSRRSSWSYENKEIPCLKFSFSILLKTIIKKLFHKKDLMEWMYKQVISKVETDEANIAVERICGPILFLSSASDAIWPSLYHCETAIKRLRDKSFPYPYKHITYEKSGHMLTLPYQSIPNLKKCNGYLQEWEEACLESWKQTLDFLDKWGKDSSSN